MLPDNGDEELVDARQRIREIVPRKERGSKFFMMIVLKGILRMRLLGIVGIKERMVQRRIIG